MPDRAVIGRNTPRVDGRERVTGSAIYGVDKQLPGMLWAKVKRSPLPFARVVSIDTKRAEAMPGVKAVITSRDIKQFRYGPSGEEQALADEYVRFIGDAVAAVAAVDEDTAEDALELIDVEYQELTPVLDMEQAMQPGAPAVHPEKAVIKNNVASHIDYVRGRGKAAFAEADVIVEGRFSTQISYHAYMEPISATVDWTDAEKVTMWGSLQRPFDAREQMARALGVPESDVRVLICFMGGGFGARRSFGTGRLVEFVSAVVPLTLCQH